MSSFCVSFPSILQKKKRKKEKSIRKIGHSVIFRSNAPCNSSCLYSFLIVLTWNWFNFNRTLSRAYGRIDMHMYFRLSIYPWTATIQYVACASIFFHVIFNCTIYRTCTSPVHSIEWEINASLNPKILMKIFVYT